MRQVLADSLSVRLLIGWAVATLGSVAGIYCSGAFNWPVGAAIVCVLGAVLLLVVVAHKFRRTA